MRNIPMAGAVTQFIAPAFYSSKMFVTPTAVQL